MQYSLSRFIHSKSLVLYLLYPLALLFQTLVSIRRALYQKNIFKQTRVKVPVVIIGNISVGGTGKTPLVIELAKQLRQQGYKPGIITRGYKSQSVHYPVVVNDESTAEMVGDEALLLQRQSACPVIVDPKRVRAAHYLLQHFVCDIILSDDGLQHYALARDIEIAVVDAARGFGTGLCLPAGPLREPRSRLQQVDFIINNTISFLPIIQEKGKGVQTIPQTYPMHLQPKKFINFISQEQQDATFFQNKIIHAVAGIGNPQRFFQTLQELGLTIIPHAFPDHHAFTVFDLDFEPNSLIIMTEKDAVKCQAFAEQRHWYLPVKAKLPQEFIKDFGCHLSKLNLS